MAAKAKIDYPRGITFEQVWAGLMEDRQQMKELREQMKENDRQVREQMKETDRQMKETDKKLGKLGDRFGEMVEYMVMPNLLEKFRELGFVFTRVNPRSVIRDENYIVMAEIDINLENGDMVMIVEVKSKPTIRDVTDHVKRMQKIRDYVDKRNDKRKYLGTIGGMVIKDNVKQFAFKNGFYVAEPSGETFNILVPEGQYSPREW